MPCYLWLIRHGKAQDHSRGSGDHDRDLAPRGERDGVLIADWLAHQSHPAEWIWSSSALRTQRTSAIVAQAFGGQVIEVRPAYNFSAQLGEEALILVRKFLKKVVPDDGIKNGIAQKLQAFVAVLKTGFYFGGRRFVAQSELIKLEISRGKPQQ